jgi:hypothetical protein
LPLKETIRMLRGLDANAWATLIIQLLVLLTGSVTALWAYTKYVLERNLLAPVEFSIETAVPGSLGGATVMEVLLHLKNVGSSTLVARNIRVDIRYAGESRKPILVTSSDPQDPLLGRLYFGGSLRKELAAGSWHNTVDAEAVRRRTPTKKTRALEGRGFLLLDDDTFVQAGVDQTYTFVTALPEGCRYVLVWASFEYAQRPRGMQNFFVGLSRRLGLIQYTLKHVSEPHTVERLVRLPAPSDRASATAWPSPEP